MASSLSNLVDNLAEGIHKIICKNCDCSLEYEIRKCQGQFYKIQKSIKYLAIKIIQTKLMKN